MGRGRGTRRSTTRTSSGRRSPVAYGPQIAPMNIEDEGRGRHEEDKPIAFSPQITPITPRTLAAMKQRRMSYRTKSGGGTGSKSQG